MGVATVDDNVIVSDPAAAKLEKSPVVPKPDEEYYRKLIAQEDSKAAELKKRLAELNNKISESSSGRDEFQRQKDLLLEKLNDVNSQIRLLEDERTHIQGQIVEKQKTGRELRNQAATMQKSIGFRTEDDIDKRIIELEKQLVKSSVTVKQEKDLIAEIQKLKKSKPQLKKVSRISNEAENIEADNANEMRVRLVVLGNELRELKDERRVTAEKLKTLNEERAVATAPLKDLFDERTELKKQMYLLTTKQEELQSELAVKQMAFRAYQNRLKQEKWVSEKTERKRRQMKAERDELLRHINSMEENVMSSKVFVVRGMMEFLKTQIDAYEAAKAEAGESHAADTHADNSVASPVQGGLEGFVELKKEVDQDQWMNKGKKKKGGKQKTAVKQISDSINLSLDALSTFVSLNIDYPKNIGEAKLAIEALQKEHDKLVEESRVQSASIQSKLKEMQDKLRDLDNSIKEFELANPMVAQKKGDQTSPSRP